MEKKIMGIILTIIGIAGLVIAGYYFMNTSKAENAVKSIALYGILGGVFFAAGVGLLKNTNDKAT